MITYHNLIILDRSGSMSSIRSQAVGGVNETLGTIRAFAKANPDTRQRVTLLSFCACNMNYVFNDTPIEQTTPLTNGQYRPCCGTPLYDAIGASCSELLGRTLNSPTDKVSVTIITDGYENASKHWSHKAIRDLIASLKERGWLVTYIGTDHDVEAVSMSINIDNCRSFDKTDEGTTGMFTEENECRMDWMASVKDCVAPTAMREANAGYFDRRNKKR